MKNKLLVLLSVFVLIICSLAFTACAVDDSEGNDEGSRTIDVTEEEVNDTEADEDVSSAPYIEYSFRNSNLLNQHYQKHGRDMGFANPKEYEMAASDVINNPDVLSKVEAEDGDMCYYLEETNEFVVLSTDGYIRTYFCPDRGKSYFDRQ